MKFAIAILKFTALELCLSSVVVPVRRITQGLAAPAAASFSVLNKRMVKAQCSHTVAFPLCSDYSFLVL